MGSTFYFEKRTRRLFLKRANPMFENLDTKDRINALKKMKELVILGLTNLGGNPQGTEIKLIEQAFDRLIQHEENHILSANQSWKKKFGDLLNAINK